MTFTVVFKPVEVVAVTLLTDPIAAPATTVTGELGGVAREANVNVTQVECSVVFSFQSRGRVQAVGSPSLASCKIGRSDRNPKSN